MTSGKIRAVHSSSAICVNLFQYWMDSPDARYIAGACNLCAVRNTSTFAIQFEEKFPIPGFGRSPNLDVTIRFKDRLVAIESKFTEPYGGREKGKLSPYLRRQGIWHELPAIRELAKKVENADLSFHHLDVPQLIKHALALKHSSEPRNKTLLYLWYGSSFKEGHLHRREIEQLTAVFAKDGADFFSITYQEVIAKLALLCRGVPAHTDYIRYITRRYL